MHEFEEYSDEYVEHHSTIRSGAAGRATDGEDLPAGSALEVDEELADRTEREAGDQPDLEQVPDPDGSRHPL